MESRFPCKKNTGVKNRVVYILLPICVDYKYDVFFNVLKNVVGRVGRTKLAEFYIDNALKTGMLAKEIVIDANDMSLSWKISHSKREDIKRAKLLGFWSTTNFPTFGRVFFDDNWQAPENNCVKVESINGTTLMTAAQIDEIIFPKMSCHLVQLNVSQSTVNNLKHFVRVPIDQIEVGNEIGSSKQMKVFDIKQEYLETCWTSLKFGEWRMHTSNQMVKETNCLPLRRTIPSLETVSPMESVSHNSMAKPHCFTSTLPTATAVENIDFETDDPIVKECRPKLLALEFALINLTKNDKFRPAFIHPADSDGKRRAQEVASNGYPSDEKIEFEVKKDDVPQQKKAAAQIKKLKLLNKKFKFSFK